MDRRLQQALSTAIKEATGSSFEISSARSQGGGCINEAYIVGDSCNRFFVKMNSASAYAMFEAEAEALAEIASANSIRAPEPVAHGVIGSQSYLVLEALEFGSAKPGSWEAMGRQLAQLHRSGSERFGWHRDNVIGSTPQYNQWTEDWPTFFREQRLRPQFELAARKGYRFEQAGELLSRTESLLADHSPAPSLLHGDLWSGNAGFLSDGTPVIFDPGTYYGDRETDLAFSEFFGGFPTAFYAAYEKEWPLATGYERRKQLYNLYHVVNHANLFGGGYASQAAGMIRSLMN